MFWIVDKAVEYILAQPDGKTSIFISEQRCHMLTLLSSLSVQTCIIGRRLLRELGNEQDAWSLNENSWGEICTESIYS